MRILITGVDGFLGTHLAAGLRLDGHEIVGISKDTIPNGENAFRCVDIRDRQSVFDAIAWARAELCIHLAAMAHADVPGDKERLVREVNVDGALHLLDALESIGLKDVICFSTAKVLAETTSPEGIEENQTPMGVGVYAESKRAVEESLRARTAEGRLCGVIVRPTAVIGPSDDKGNYAKMLKMVSRGFFPVLGGGKARRSVVFVRTLVERIRIMARLGLRPGRCYVFSDGIFSLREIVDAMQGACGFAFCPSVSLGRWTDLLRSVDVAFGAEPGKGPFGNALKRLTASFAIQSQNWTDDYGALPPVDLTQEMCAVVAASRGRS